MPFKDKEVDRRIRNIQNSIIIYNALTIEGASIMAINRWVPVYSLRPISRL